MMKKSLTLCFLFVILLFGCAGLEPVHEVSPQFSDMRPSVIAIMPPMNETVDLDAPKPFIKYLENALRARGYRVVDQEIINNKLEKEGIHIAEEAGSIPDKELGEALGAQALLFTTVTSWETTYLGVYASVTVGARFQLIDAKTSNELWKVADEEKEARIAVDDDSVAETAAFAAFQAYEPYVKKLVYKSFSKLPEGPFYKKPKPVKARTCFSPKK